MFKNHKAFSSILAVVISISLLLGGLAFSTFGKTTVEFWTRNSREEVMPFVDAFEDKYPDISVKIQALTGDVQVTTKLTAAVQGGGAPDVVGLDVVDVKKFVEMDALYPLDEFIKEDDIKVDSFSTGMMGMARVEGKIYGLPWGGDSSVIFYNKDHFREVGLDPENPPSSWAEFTEAARKLTRDTNGDGETDQYGFAYVPAHSWVTTFYWLPYFWSNGGEFFEDGQVALNSEAGVEALTFLVDLYRKYDAVPSSVIGPDADALRLFKMGRVSMKFEGPSDIPTMENDVPDLDLGVMTHPTPDGEPADHNFCGGDIGVIMKSSNKKEAAWKFVKYITSPEGQMLWTEGAYVPTREELLETEYYQTHPARRTALKALLNSHKPPVTSHYAKIQTYLRDAFMKASKGQMTPKEALDWATEKSNKLIEESGTK